MPLDADTVCQLHFDGADNDVSTIDSAAPNRIVSFGGNAHIYTGEKKFGVSSLALDGSGDGLRMGGEPFGTGPITYDCWLYLTNAANYRVIFDTRGSGGSGGYFAAALDSSRKIRLIQSPSNVWLSISTMAVTLNQWTHIAVVKQADTYIKVYFNGVADDQVPYMSVSSFGWPTLIGIDADGNNGFAGYVDEFRISKVARWTNDFTPPSSPYEDNSIGGGTPVGICLAY